jgi:hypothetical protein
MKYTNLTDYIMPQAAAEYEYLNIVSQTFTTYFGKEEIL